MTKEIVRTGIVRAGVRHSVTILADVGERRSGVGAALERIAVDVEWVRLEAADYAFGGQIGVERKRVVDLHRSIISGRLWRQLTGMRRLFTRPFLLVEGPRIYGGRVSADGVRGALLEAVDQGVSVIWSTSVNDSAAWLRRLAVRAQRPAASHRSLRRAYRRHVTPVGALAVVPGISVSLAERLIERYGSIAAVAAASTEDLQAVPGIGPARAASVMALLSGRFAAERESA